MSRQIAFAGALAALALGLLGSVPAQADENGSRVQRHQAVRHSQAARVRYAGCERVVVRETGYRYYPHAQIYSWEPQEITRVYCAPVVRGN